MVKTRTNKTEILKVATLYYEAGLTQEQIAVKYGVSRPTVIRLLQQARDEGFVQIRITKPLPESTKREADVELKFADMGIREAIVIDGEGIDPKSAVAKGAGDYLSSKLKKTDILGVGWSTTLLELPSHVDPEASAPARVVQLGGGISFPGGGNAQEIALRLGRRLGSPVETISAPVLVKNKAVRDALLEDPSISSAYQWAANCTIAVFGLGTVDSTSTLIQAGYLTAADISATLKQGAVGDILAQFFDVDGRVISMPWQDRMITQPFEAMTSIDNIVLVAAGRQKGPALLGAIRTGMIRTIIIDMELASEILSF